MKTFFNCGLTIAVLFMTGCSIINPYHENFACETDDTNGHCVDTSTAYLDSIGQIALEDVDGECESCSTRNKKATSQNAQGNSPRQSLSELAYGVDPEQANSEQRYRDAVMRKMTGLLQQPETPMVQPAKYMRVMIAPYQDEGDILWMPRYTFLQVEDAKFIMGEYLNLNEEN